MDMYTEFMGFDNEIYSMFHCELYTITFAQDANGNLLSISYETDDGPIRELQV